MGKTSNTGSKAKLDWETVQPTSLELFAGGIFLAIWVLIFAVGLMVPTSKLREAIINSIDARMLGSPTTQPAPQAVVVQSATTQPNDSTTPIRLQIEPTTPPPPPSRSDLTGLEIVYWGAIVIVAYTVPNLLFLSITASFLGRMARRWSSPFTYDPEPLADHEEAAKDLKRAYTAAVLGGFLVYLLIIAGYLAIVPESAVSQLSPGQYVRMAGLISSLAFVAGCEPRTLSRLLSMVTAGSPAKSGDNPAANEAPKNSKEPPTPNPPAPSADTKPPSEVHPSEEAQAEIPNESVVGPANHHLAHAKKEPATQLVAKDDTMPRAEPRRSNAPSDTIPAN